MVLAELLRPEPCVHERHLGSPGAARRGRELRAAQERARERRDDQRQRRQPQHQQQHIPKPPALH